MRRRRLAAWLVSIPLMVMGSQVAHVLAYRLAYPSAHVRLSALLASGHGYMGQSAYLPMLLGLVFAAEIVGAGWALVGSVRRGPARPVPAWAFALLPLLAFILQELLERWLSSSSFPWWMVLQPTFGIGLLLQLPFAVATYLVARLLLRAADVAGRILTGSLVRPRQVSVAVRLVLLPVAPPRAAYFRGWHFSRGPPHRGLLTAAGTASPG